MATFSCRHSVTCLLSMTMGERPAEASTTISRIFSSLRASPALKRKSASVSLTVIFLCFRRVSVWIALSRSNCKSAVCSDLSTNTWQRERRGVMTSKEGFSVVAPIKTTVPSSTAPRSASCWALLNRWISSIKRIGEPLPANREVLLALSMTSRTSFTPEETADS